jgi:hypothetical protein
MERKSLRLDNEDGECQGQGAMGRRALRLNYEDGRMGVTVHTTGMTH